MRAAACLAAATVLLAAGCGGSSQYNHFVACASKLCSELPGPETRRAVGQPTRAERELGALERADHNLPILRRALPDAARRKKLQEVMRKARYEATFHRHDPRPYSTYEALYREDHKIYEAERTIPGLADCAELNSPNNIHRLSEGLEVHSLTKR